MPLTSPICEERREKILLCGKTTRTVNVTLLNIIVDKQVILTTTEIEYTVNKSN